MIENQWLFLIYLVAGCLFIFSIRGLSSPKTARAGNWLGMAGMLLAADGTLWILPEQNHMWIFAAIIAGGIVGIISGLKVKMTALPQMIAAFNGVGGLSSVLVGLAEIWRGTEYNFQVSVGLVVGAIAFAGSIIAFSKLQGLLHSHFGHFPWQNLLNLFLLLGTLWFWYDFNTHGDIRSAYILTGMALLWGLAVTLPVGGADMPIVISVLNACSGWAAAAIGFSLANIALIITGAIVGASGTILSFIMTKAINRSLWAVLFMHQAASHKLTGNNQKSARSGNPEDAAFILENASKVIIVPGYGMAVAQAQHALQTMSSILQNKYNVNVKFAIHPVAGRMPGHMNVLLAEANVPYDEVYELDEINREFASADVAYVIGANDITNPAARSDSSSPIYGMPILEVEKAKTVFFIKRSLGTGYAGVENPLFFADNTIMLYGDAKKVTDEIVQVLEQG